MAVLPRRLRELMRRANLAAGLAAALILVVLGYRFVVLLTETPRNAEPSGSTVVCFGDSLTYGSGAAAESSYPAHLARMLGEPVINAGVAGDTTARALRRLDADVLAHDPRIVLLTLGGNDLKNSVPLEEAFANLEQIVTRIQDRGALVVVGGIDVPLYGRGFPAAYQDLCKRLECVLVPDVYKGIWGRRNLMSDRIHPNGDGYEIMARGFYDAVKPYAK